MGIGLNLLPSRVDHSGRKINITQDVGFWKNETGRERRIDQSIDRASSGKLFGASSSSSNLFGGMMATSMELPTKRECESVYEHGGTNSGKEEEASKKAKTEEAGSDSEIMSESFAEEEELRSKCQVREYQLFLQSKGDSDRATKICSEKDALELFSDDEMKIYSKKVWQIRPTPGSLTDYDRLALYPSEEHPYFNNYVNYYFTYEFDCAYQKFTDELNETIKWGSIRSDERPTAEAIWKKHLSVDVDLTLLDESICTAIRLSKVTQTAKELIPLFVDLYKREVDKKDSVQALKVIIEEKGLDCYPLNKVLIEEVLEKEEGRQRRLWLKYDEMKNFITIQKGEASLEDNRLKDLVTSYFEIPLIACGDKYIDYVKEKIRVAQELLIL